jgi:ribonucleoside-diphosphate reductase subunit M2
MVDLGLEKHYNSKQPFSFMSGICLESKANFFERKVTEYKKAEVGTINLSEDF